jgi:GAF domain-containing protein
MSHHSTTDWSLPESAGGSAVRLGQMRVSEPAATVEPGAGLAFPGEDRGRSLVEMAQRDLDAALQLLAERAQYITGATGAAIALRHAGEHDMLCRASAGPNAPELGALLSAEFGLSGESVRTRQPLRCDDAEHDARVNRESCHALGIASVAVVPVVGDDEVLGVFELFSGQPNAFGERDVAALQRLAEMVETAARFARAAEGVPRLTGEAEQQQSPPEPEIRDDPAEVAEVEVEASAGEAPILKPLMWSASAPSGDLDLSGESSGDESLPDYGNVPLALRALRKCETCGFPVSDGRRLCLDCEDRDSKDKDKDKNRRGQQRLSGRDERESVKAAALENSASEDSAGEFAAEDVQILSAAMEASPSWWAANKYVLGAIVAAILAVVAVVFLR